MDNRMRWICRWVLIFAVSAAGATAEEYRVEVLKAAPPTALSAAIRSELNAQGYRLVDQDGKSYAEFWLRKAIPASGKPSTSKGPVLFPGLADGEFLGALLFPGEGHDYRDQVIPHGAYTMRYGLQPANGDHRGVSPHRDHVLLIPCAKDSAPASLARKKLIEQSAETAGASHPAVLMLLPAPEAGAKAKPTVVHDELKKTWGAVVPLRLAVKGERATGVLSVQLVLVGVGMN